MSATMEPQSSHSDVLIYFLASPKDEDVCEAIHRHLRPIIRNSEIPIRVLDDFDIPAGTDRDEHRGQLLDADIVLSLISADFIDDDDVYGRNQRVIERYNKGETMMVSILVRNCLWKASPLARFPLLPKNLQPLNNKQFWNSEDDAMTAVVGDLYDSINGILSEMATLETVTPTETAPPPAAPPVRVDLTDDRGGEAVGLVGAAAVPDGGTTGDTIPLDPQTDGAGLAPAAMLDTEPDADVVVELPPAEPVTSAPPEHAAEAQTEAPPAVTVTMARQPQAVPVETDWRRRYYRRVTAKRALALLVDYVVLFMVPAVVYLFVAGFVGISENSDFGVMIAIGLVMFYLLAPAMEASTWRATPGKRLLKLQITTKEGDRISYGRAFVRNVLRSVVLYSYGITLGLALVYQYFRFRKTKKLFHDEVSSTVIGERLTA